MLLRTINFWTIAEQKKILKKKKWLPSILMCDDKYVTVLHYVAYLMADIENEWNNHCRWPSEIGPSKIVDLCSNSNKTLFHLMKNQLRSFTMRKSFFIYLFQRISNSVCFVIVNIRTEKNNQNAWLYRYDQWNGGCQPE